MPEWISNPDWLSTIVWFFIYFALTVDGLRAVIAMLGIVPRNAKWLSRLIYGRYDRKVLYEALQDLGYTQRDAEVLVSDFQKGIVTHQASGVNRTNVTMHILSVLANYIQKYPRTIQYGGRTPSDSTYYVNTMEAAHNDKSLVTMADAMVTLVSEHLQDRKPDIIFTPKGGNPIFAKAVADSFGAKLVVVKPKSDKSRVTMSTPKSYEEELLLFKSNYEGSWDITAPTGERKLGIIIDCNASGGSQLCDIARELNELIHTLSSADHQLDIDPIADVFVLFRADTRHHGVDQKFEDLGLHIHRFFDLQEADKKALYQLHKTHSDGTLVDTYSPADQAEIQKIIKHLDEEGKLYWTIQ